MVLLNSLPIYGLDFTGQNNRSFIHYLDLLIQAIQLLIQ